MTAAAISAAATNNPWMAGTRPAMTIRGGTGEEANDDGAPVGRWLATAPLPLSSWPALCRPSTDYLLCFFAFSGGCADKREGVPQSHA